MLKLWVKLVDLLLQRLERDLCRTVGGRSVGAQSGLVAVVVMMLVVCIVLLQAKLAFFVGTHSLVLVLESGIHCM
jgi:hypothetical protein